MIEEEKPLKGSNKTKSAIVDSAAEYGGAIAGSVVGSAMGLAVAGPAGAIGGYRTKCVSAPIIHWRYSTAAWNSPQTTPEPCSSGAPSSRFLDFEAIAKSPSTSSSVGIASIISAAGRGDSVCM